MTPDNRCHGITSLLAIMRALRGPGGCPWDMEQSPESLAPYILEEACELIDAIESGDTELILDELGDLLLQVVFQAQIFNERQLFDFDDVANGIAEKLLRRHPHVFDPDTVNVSVDKLDAQWERIKRSETTNKKSCFADHLPSRLPALQKAQKLVAKAHKAGRDLDVPEAPPLSNPLHPLSVQAGDAVIHEEAMGRMLFQLVRLAQQSGLDAETALRRFTRGLLERLDAD